MKPHKMIHHLPLEAYTSQDWFDREQKAIFSKQWRFAGFVEDVTQAGQFITVQAGLNNIFIVMDKDGTRRAFHNLCRHRGTQLLRSAGKGGKAITCPYHDWTYNLRGELISVPEQANEFASLDHSCLGLKPASMGVWRGMLFVHPDPDAIDIDEWFAPIVSHLGPHKVEELVEYPNTSTSDIIKANWKIVVENYIDHYHLKHLHSGTLSMYDHARAEFGFYGPHFAFREPLSAGYAKDINQNSPYPLVIPQDQSGAWVPMLFPGLGLAESEFSWSVFHIVPLGPDRTRVETRTRLKDASFWAFSRQNLLSWNYWTRKIRGKYATGPTKDDPMLSGDFMAEDIFVCEQQQKSFQSPHFEVGPAAVKGEKPLLDHQKLVLKYMEGSL